MHVSTYLPALYFLTEYNARVEINSTGSWIRFIMVQSRSRTKTVPALAKLISLERNPILNEMFMKRGEILNLARSINN